MISKPSSSCSEGTSAQTKMQWVTLCYLGCCGNFFFLVSVQIRQSNKVMNSVCSHQQRLERSGTSCRRHFMSGVVSLSLCVGMSDENICSFLVYVILVLYFIFLINFLWLFRISEMAYFRIYIFEMKCILKINRMIEQWLCAAFLDINQIMIIAPSSAWFMALQAIETGVMR